MKLNTTKYTICSDMFPAKTGGYRIAMLSDLHDTSYGAENENLFERVNSENPDIIIIAGDLVTAKGGRDFSPALKLLEELATKWPVYYGLGNHEQRLQRKTFRENKGIDFDYMEAVSKIKGVKLLDNESVLAPVGEDNIKIIGLSLDKKFYAKGKNTVLKASDITEVIGKKDDCFTVMIAHNPVYFSAYAEWGAELVFAGHLHGGIVRLPIVGGVLSPQVSFFPKYDKGLFKKENSSMLVSAGLGKHTIPIRLWNPAEVLVVELRNR